MSTFTEMKARIQRNIVDDNAEVVQEIQGYINDAQEELEDLRLFPECRALAYGVILVAEVRKLMDLPSGWNGMRKDPYYYDGTGAKTPMRWIPDTEEIDKTYSLDPNETGSPKQLEVTATLINVYPLPDDNAAAGDYFTPGRYIVVVPYWKRLTALSVDNESNIFTTTQLLRRYLEQRATAEALFFNRDQEEGLLWMAKATATMKKIKREYKLRILPRNLTLAPRRSVEANRDQRRL